MSSPVSQRIQHRAMGGVVVVAPSQDHIMLDSLSLDGCILPASTPRTTTTCTTEDVDIRDYNNDDDDDYYFAPSPLSCLSSIFTSAATSTFQLQTSPHHRHVMMRDQIKRISPTMRSFVIADKALDPMMLDCLSLDGCILPPPPSCAPSSTMNMTIANMVMTRKEKDL